MSPALHCPKNMTSTTKSGHNGCRSLADESAFLVAQMIKRFLVTPETQVHSLGWEDPLEKGKATHSSIQPWRIPRTV